MSKIGVEAFVLKKIPKDLPLHPIPVSLKWDHLSDLKLAGSNFRTPVCIDLLLRTEVFTSILRDGWRTGPRGTPSAINTHFRWVLFGKIEGSNVVDVANLTLEQDVLRELMGLKRSYVAVLTADRKRDLRYLRQRNRRVVEGQQPNTWRRQFNHTNC